jgi:dimethylamine monooxygenase subunit A
MQRPQYLPFLDGQWRLAMNLKPLQLADWIEIDAEFERELELKSQLLEQRHADVFVSLPSSLPAQREVLDLLVNHLCEYFPERYRQHNDQLQNLSSEQVWEIVQPNHRSPMQSGPEPLELASRLVQEDLCLMEQVEAGSINAPYMLTAASVCFPSRWELQPKLGKPLTQIHQPVPAYDQKLANPVDQFFARLKSNHPVYRLNWSIVDSPDLFLESRFDTQPNPAITAANAGETLWLRVERQTLRRLPQTKAILFTIRTYINPLATCCDPATATQLNHAIQQIPTAMQAYKSLAPIREALLSYLETCAQP